MKKNKGKIITAISIVLITILVGLNTYAHSGRTDSSGGHKDNQNKSGLGSYHYHCGGHPAHLHTNGVCPYSSTSSSSGSSSSSSSSSSSGKSTSSSKDSSSSGRSSSSGTSTTSSSATATAEPTTIDVTQIQINEKIDNIEVGESKTLTATITPSDATDKNITWKSSDESVATVTQSGKIVAKKAGVVDITATSSNGKTSTIKINIKEEPKAENIAMINTTETDNTITTNTTKSSEEESSVVPAIILLAIIMGGGYYWSYRKQKKNNENKNDYK